LDGREGGVTLVLSRTNLAENYGDRDLDVGNASKRKLFRDNARRSMTIERGALRGCHPSNLSFDTKLPSADGPRANDTAARNSSARSIKNPDIRSPSSSVC
jgi:hypothetical protein